MSSPGNAVDPLFWPLVIFALAFAFSLVAIVAVVMVMARRGSGVHIQHAETGGVIERLCALLSAALEQRPAFALRKLEVMLLQSTREWGDGTAYERSATALLTAAESPEQRVEALFFKGVERLEAFHATPAPDAAQILDARQHLSAAAALADRHTAENHLRFSILVSAGNAHRQGTSADLERALALYAEADELGAPSEHEAARLAKVRADALIARGTGTDIRDAFASLEQALAIRRSGPRP